VAGGQPQKRKTTRGFGFRFSFAELFFVEESNARDGSRIGKMYRSTMCALSKATITGLIRVIAMTGCLVGAAQAAQPQTLLARVDASAAQDFCKVPFSTLNGSKTLDGKYAGQCRNGVPEGDGAASFTNGDRYQGAFAHGKIDGRGTWTSAKGSTYSGEWRGGQRHGVGTYQWDHGSAYAGDWFYDRRHGMGKLTWPSGDRFEGEFRNNKYYAGTFYTSSGKRLACTDGQCR
jgi:hypothetical protein